MNGNIYGVEAFDPYFLALMALHMNTLDPPQNK
jgi:hypothetical protein